MKGRLRPLSWRRDALRFKREDQATDPSMPSRPGLGVDRHNRTISIRGFCGEEPRGPAVSWKRMEGKVAAFQHHPGTAKVRPRRTSHGQTQTSGSGGADLSFPVAAHPLPRISSADNARRDLRRQKTSVQERSSQTRAPSLQNCASGPPKNPYAMRRYRRRSRRGRTIRT